MDEQLNNVEGNEVPATGTIRGIIGESQGRVLTLPTEGCRVDELGKYNDDFWFDSSATYMVGGLRVNGDFVITPEHGQLFVGKAHSNG